MQWYLLKTWDGREEELVREIQKNIPSHCYKDCFVIYQERIWRKQQRSIVHVEPLFPGCVFLTCEHESEKMEDKLGQMTNMAAEGLELLYRDLSMDRMKAAGSERFCDFAYVKDNSSFDALHPLPLIKKDAEFLEKLSGKEHRVKLSYVQKDEEGNICKMSEPLCSCKGQIERMQWKKRYAMVRCRLWGEERILVLGIVLKEDTGSKLLYKNRYGDKRNILVRNAIAGEALAKEMA